MKEGFPKVSREVFFGYIQAEGKVFTITKAESEVPVTVEKMLSQESESTAQARFSNIDRGCTPCRGQARWSVTLVRS